jgi:hypothetical protein
VHKLCAQQYAALQLGNNVCCLDVEVNNGCADCKGVIVAGIDEDYDLLWPFELQKRKCRLRLQRLNCHWLVIEGRE